VKTLEREQARRLRRTEGRSIKEIARLLSVSRSSVSLWVRDIQLTPEQHEALRQRNPAYNAQQNGRAVWAAHCRKLRQEWQEDGRRLARRRDAFHAAGCMLYWAEGDKNRRRLGLANADEEVLRFFVVFLRAFFRVSDDRMRVWCNLFADHAERQSEVEQFWLDVLDLPGTCLTKSTVNVYSKYSRRKRRNMLPHGTCKLTVCDVRIVQSNLRLDPGVRRLRAPRVARLGAVCGRVPSERGRGRSSCDRCTTCTGTGGRLKAA
jgi:transposase-like protein